MYMYTWRFPVLADHAFIDGFSLFHKPSSSWRNFIDGNPHMIIAEFPIVFNLPGEIPSITGQPRYCHLGVLLGGLQADVHRKPAAMAESTTIG